MIKLLILICVASSTLARPEPESKPSKTTCGYQSCHPTKKGMLNVHLVPHTHDDVGWLKTLDEYYYGSKSGIQRAGVQYILDSVVEELKHDPNKRFIYVETAFFWKWWKEQDDHKRHQVKSLVNSGQLEFIGGAWAMNDEATTNYQSTIDQFTWGFRKLNETFGDCGRPKIGWQIDPFGHSRELASMMAQFGFDGLLFGRLDYQDKATRILKKETEMVWQGSPTNLGSSADLFTSVLFNTYSPPPSFCFDILCNDEPIVDNKKSPKYNAEERVETFIKFVQKQKEAYASNNVLITMGEDFTYQDAHVWFKNLDKLIRLVNEKQSNGSNVNLLYSTPSCYVKSVNEDNLSLTTKDDDFFPYASDPNSFWTGYFTSRPTIKYFERKGNNFLQVCKQLYALTDLGPEDKGDLDALRSAMGVLQHHDAITGTEKQLVAFDYARILSEGIAECEIVVDAALRKIIAPKKAEDGEQKLDDQFQTVTCPLLNISQCATTEDNKSFVVTVYNPLSKPVTHYVRLPVKDNVNYTVLCPMGKKQVTQLVPISDGVKRIPGRDSKAEYELVFGAKNLPPLGFRSYYVSQNAKVDTEDSGFAATQANNALREKNVLGDHMSLSLTLDENGALSGASFGDRSISLKQNIYYYTGAIGNNEEFKNRSSGAYIFRPTDAEPTLLSDNSKGSIKQYKGPIVEEVQVIYSNWVSETIRMYKDEQHAEVNWVIGPIPIDDNIGKEIIIRYETDIQSDKVFYTDSNGREMLKRVRDFRPTWKLELAEKVAGNYYPVTSKITIKDDKNQFSVLTDRAQGGSSLKDGQIELMVHRRLLHDDAFGVGEALNETAFGGKGLVAAGTHCLTVGRPAAEKFLAQRKLMDSWIFLTPTPSISFEQWQKNYKMEYSGLKGSVPSNVKILTLEPWKGRSLLLRVENIFEVGEDELYSKEANVNLQDLFSAFKIVSAQETTLGANLLLKDLQRLKWKSESNYIKKQGSFDYQPLTDYEVTLKPMQIRTFIIEVERV